MTAAAEAAVVVVVVVVVVVIAAAAAVAASTVATVVVVVVAAAATAAVSSSNCSNNRRRRRRRRRSRSSSSIIVAVTVTKYHTCHSGLEPRVVVAGDLVLVVVVPGVVEVVVDGGAAHEGSVESDGGWGRTWCSRTTNTRWDMEGTKLKVGIRVLQ